MPLIRCRPIPHFAVSKTTVLIKNDDFRGGRGATGKAPRDTSLDVVRGFAILLVLSHHWVTPPENAGRLSFFAKPLSDFGWTGVDLFFVLSGFLIGGLLFKELLATGRLDIRRFLARRAFKIWPQYFAYLVFLISAALMRGETFRAAIWPLWPSFIHLQNYSRRIMTHTWSLAVEEHFYLTLPFFLLALWKLAPHAGRIRHFKRIFIICLIAVLLIRWVTTGSTFDLYKQVFPTHVRIDSLLFGVLLAYINAHHTSAWHGLLRWWPIFLTGGAIALLPVFLLPRGDRFVFTIGFSLLYVGYGCLLIAALGAARHLHLPSLSQVLIRPLARVGILSYGIYIWHDVAGRQPVNRWLTPVLSHAPGEIQYFACNLAYLGLAIVAAVFATALIEGPALAIRERLFPSADQSRDPRTLEGLIVSSKAAVSLPADIQTDSIVSGKPGIRNLAPAQ